MPYIDLIEVTKYPFEYDVLNDSFIIRNGLKNVRITVDVLRYGQWDETCWETGEIIHNDVKREDVINILKIFLKKLD